MLRAWRGIKVISRPQMVRAETDLSLKHEDFFPFGMIVVGVGGTRFELQKKSGGSLGDRVES